MRNQLPLWVGSEELLLALTIYLQLTEPVCLLHVSGLLRHNTNTKTSNTQEAHVLVKLFILSAVTRKTREREQKPCPTKTKIQTPFIPEYLRLKTKQNKTKQGFTLSLHKKKQKSFFNEKWHVSLTDKWSMPGCQTQTNSILDTSSLRLCSVFTFISVIVTWLLRKSVKPLL